MILAASTPIPKVPKTRHFDFGRDNVFLIMILEIVTGPQPVSLWTMLRGELDQSIDVIGLFAPTSFMTFLSAPLRRRF